MKLYFIPMCLTFLLNSQRSRSERIPLDPSFSKDTVCRTQACRRAAEMLRGNMNHLIRPCDDFYGFACGGFIYGNLDQQMYRRLKDLNDKILGILKSNNDYNIQAIAKIRHIFSLCMDEDAIKTFGDNVIKLQLNNVGLPSMPPFHSQTNIPNKFSRILAKLHRDAGIPFLFSLNVNKDYEDFKINRLFIQLDMFTVQHIEDRVLQYEVNRQKRNHEYFKQYMMGAVKYLYRIEEMKISKEILGLISSRVDEVIQFLLSVNEVLQEYFYSPPNYEYITIQKLQETTDKILQDTNIKFEWQEYLLQLFENMFDNVEDYFGSEIVLIVENMKYLESIFKVISSIDAAVFNASLWWVTVNDVTNISYKELLTLDEKFREKTYGFLTMREYFCLNFVKDRYSHAIIHVLLQEENLNRAKYEIQNIVANLKNSFIEIIEKTSWMDKSTREEAKLKVYYMETFISHESWVEKAQKIETKYAGVNLGYTWYETRLKENVRRVEEKLKLLFVTNKKNKVPFPIDSMSIINNYSYTENIAGIPFGMLGLPFYNHGLYSMDYGGIGYVLAYLLTMVFHEIGRKIDYRGIERNWWKESTLQKFNEKAKCFVDFYSTFHINGTEIQMDGNRTLDSNISDNVAMELLLSAYEKFEHDYGYDAKLIGFEEYNSKQLLTLAMASMMCLKMPQDVYYERIIKNSHSVPKLRINGIFMNSKMMAYIWGCAEGDPMNPKNKCDIF